MPSANTGSDGLGGLHIRGGGSDQNLFLLDDMPIYNPFHMLGATSIFNHDFLQAATFTSGQFHAKYGDRLSSFFDVRLRDGKRDRTQVKGSIGLLAGHVILEFPVLQKKGSVMIASQKSLAGPIIRAYSKAQKKRR